MIIINLDFLTVNLNIVINNFKNYKSDYKFIKYGFLYNKI